ncbi:MAG: LysR family transcriptional regulator [Pirellulaceae bacterium]
MHLRSLKVFCDVVGCRSFSRAADENGISQSGASQVVHQLEQRLGVRLLDRSKRPFVLTPEGEVYYAGCRKLVQRFYALEEEVRALHQEVAGRVTVASIYSVGLHHMSRLVQDFLRQYPKADVRLQYQHNERVYELVRNDRVDLGLVSYPRSSKTIKAIAWRREPMVFVCAPEHRLSARDFIRLEDLAGVEMVSFDDDLRIRQEIDKTLSQRGVAVNIAMEFDNIETLKRAIEINSGVSLLPEPTIVREVKAGALISIPLAGIELFRPLGIVYRCGVELGKTAGRFIDLLRASASETPTEQTLAAETEFDHEESTVNSNRQDMERTANK